MCARPDVLVEGLDLRTSEYQGDAVAMLSQSLQPGAKLTPVGRVAPHAVMPRPG